MLFANQADLAENFGLAKNGLVQINNTSVPSALGQGVIQSGKECPSDNTFNLQLQAMIAALPEFQAELAKITDSIPEQVLPAEAVNQVQPLEIESLIANSKTVMDLVGHFKQKLQDEGIEISDKPQQIAIAKLNYLLNESDMIPAQAKQAIAEVVENLQAKAAIEGIEVQTEPITQPQPEKILSEQENINPHAALDFIGDLTAVQQPVVIENPDTEVPNTDKVQSNPSESPEALPENPKINLLIDSEPVALEQAKPENTQEPPQILISENTPEKAAEDLPEELDEFLPVPKQINQVNTNQPQQAGYDSKISVSDKDSQPLLKPENNIEIKPEQIKVAIESSADDSKPQSSGRADAAPQPVEHILAASDSPAADFKIQTAYVQENTPVNITRDTAAYVGNQIHEAIKSSAEEGRDEITIRLNPPELGRVSIKLQHEQGQITGLLEFSKTQTRVEVENLMPQLVRSLQEAGVMVRRIDIVQTQPDNPSFNQSKEHSTGDSSHNHHHNEFNYNQQGLGDNVYQGMHSQIDYQNTLRAGQSAYNDTGVNVLI